MKKASQYNMYNQPSKSSSYQNATDFDKKSDYDMYSETVRVGPLAIKIKDNANHKQISIYVSETGQKLAETELTDHSLNDHFKTILDSTEDLCKAYYKSMQKSDLTKSQKLEHYSPQANLKEIDPKFVGQGVDSRSQRAYTQHPHSFYYVAGTEPEELVTSRANKKYTVELPKEAKIYDIAHDSDNIIEKIKQENQGAFDRDAFIGKIKEAGYHGFQHSKSSMPNVVALFHSMPISHSEDIRRK